MTISIVLVEDHELPLRGLQSMLAAFDDVAVTGVARSIAEARSLVAPDLAIVDLGLPDVCRFDTVPRLLELWPDATLLVVTQALGAQLGPWVIQQRAHGAVTKGIKPAALREAVNTVLAGHIYLEPSGWLAVSEYARLRRELGHLSIRRDELTILDDLADGLSYEAVARAHATTADDVRALAARAIGDVRPLSEKQRRVLVLVAEGLGNADIADALNVERIDADISELIRRLGLPDRASRQLGRLAEKLHQGCVWDGAQHLLHYRRTPLRRAGPDHSTTQRA